MLSLEDLKNKVHSKIVAVLSAGASLLDLEKNIALFDKYDIVWTSFNYYSLMNNFILSKIGRKLDVVLECAACRNPVYENNLRIPELYKQAEQGTMILSLWKLIHSFEFMHFDYFRKKAILLDDYFKIDGMPNTLAMLIQVLAFCKPKLIVLFGADGTINLDDIGTYYQPDLQHVRRMQMRLDFSTQMKDQTDYFNEHFYEIYAQKFSESFTTKVINASPQSYINLFKKATCGEAIHQIRKSMEK